MTRDGYIQNSVQKDERLYLTSTNYCDILTAYTLAFTTAMKGMNQMKVAIELAFNGNCAEALALYEKTFGVKAESRLLYKDTSSAGGPQSPEGTEDFIMHARFMLGNDAIGLHDRTPEKKCRYGDGVAVHIGLDSADAVKAAFDVLKEGGKVGAEPGEVFFSQFYCEVKDKFGVSWILSFN